MGALYRAFRNADIDDSGTIEIDEMLEKYNFEATRFTRRMFSIFDDDKYVFDFYSHFLQLRMLILFHISHFKFNFKFQISNFACFFQL